MRAPIPIPRAAAPATTPHSSHACAQRPSARSHASPPLAHVHSQPGGDIGPTNRHLIDEWNGFRQAAPRQPLALPGEQYSRLRRRSSVSHATAPGWSPSSDELDQLWESSAACRELWRRYLDRTGKARAEAWIAAVRAGVGAALECALDETRKAVVAELLEIYPQMPHGLRPVCARWSHSHPLLTVPRPMRLPRPERRTAPRAHDRSGRAYAPRGATGRCGASSELSTRLPHTCEPRRRRPAEPSAPCARCATRTSSPSSAASDRLLSTGAASACGRRGRTASAWPTSRFSAGLARARTAKSSPRARRIRWCDQPPARVPPHTVQASSHEAAGRHSPARAIDALPQKGKRANACLSSSHRPRPFTPRSQGLFALKMMPLAHAADKRGRHHLRVERQVTARAAATCRIP